MAALALGSALGSPASSEAITLPPQFDDQFVADVPSPTALAFTPDGRILVTSQLGTLHVVDDGAPVDDPALDLEDDLCANRERGLLGVAVDPSFGLNRFIYLYYTFRKSDGCPTIGSSTPVGLDSPVNRVSRFVLSDANTVDPDSESVLIDNIPSPGGNHNAGDLHFGRDGNLYVSTGDGDCDYAGGGCGGSNDASRDQHVLLGKILRITPGGEIPFDNPFQGADSDRCNLTGQTTAGRRCKETFAWGLRNPFRIAFDPNHAGTRFFINDVGQDTWEEIDLGQAGADYGWNVREGHCARGSTSNCGAPPAGTTNPAFDYGHAATGCGSITGGAFVPAGVWPAEYDGAYIFGDYVCGKLFSLTPEGAGFASDEFADDAGAPVAMSFGPTADGQALYYLAFGPDELRRIVHSGSANRAPTAAIEADRTSGDAPLEVAFDGSGSSDPDQDALSHEWDFGDGSDAAAGAEVTHTYQAPGTYTATLTVRDGRGGEDTDSVRIDAGNTAPVAQIDSPSASERFHVGEALTLSGSASDGQDGALDDSALEWTVTRYHDDHTHPYLPPTTGNDLPLSGPEPEDLPAAATSYLEIELKATDSSGLSTTVTQKLEPSLVELRFESGPAGLELDVAGEVVETPATVTSWQAWRFPIEARDQLDPSGTHWRYDWWSDQGAARHLITTPAAPATFTAAFEAADHPHPGGATPLRVSLVPAFDECSQPDSVHVEPLALPSCRSPSPSSPELTISGAGRGASHVRFDVLNGDLDTPADEADVVVGVSLADVRATDDLADYSGPALLGAGVRLTNRTGSFPDLERATTEDLDLRLPLQCVPTASPSLGASCALNTTLDTLVPGFAREGGRAILATSSIEVLDAGPNGTLGGECPPACGDGDESVFMRQGVFTP